MKFGSALIMIGLAVGLGGSVTPTFAASCTTDDCIIWQLNGTGAGGGISYADGSVISGTVTYDVTAGAWVTATTVTDTDPAVTVASSPATAGCTIGSCAGATQSGNTWYVDPYESSNTILYLVNVNPASSLIGASYFSMAATQVFDGSDGLPANSGAGNPATTYNEMLNDANNGFIGQTFAGTCLDAECANNDSTASDPPVTGAPHVAAGIVADQGTNSALAMSTCPSPETCTYGDAGAYFSTVVPAGPPVTNPGSAPEPSTFVLLGGSLIAVGMRFRKAKVNQ